MWNHTADARQHIQKIRENIDRNRKNIGRFEYRIRWLQCNDIVASQRYMKAPFVEQNLPFTKNLVLSIDGNEAEGISGSTAS